MTNLVLYRKYRPQNFSDVIGQEHIVKTLTNAIASGMISHAYLFDGPRGTGKTTIARLLSKAINCENLQGSEPCNKCPSCLEITGGQSMDLIEIDAASHRGIDDIRELRDGIKFAPSRLKYKVFIIDECHQLSKDASNALLKTLEEPPAHAVFILATTEVHKMIPTILSRCQRFNFNKLTVLEIIKRLEKISKEEKIKIEKAALELIAIHSGGAIRDAESLLDQVLTFNSDSKKEIKAEDIKNILGLVEIEVINRLTDLIFQKKTSEAISLLNETLEKGIDVLELMKAIIDYLRQGLVMKITDAQDNKGSIITGLTKEEFQNLKKQVSGLSEQQIQKILNSFLNASGKIKYSPIPQLPIELAIIESIENLG